MSANTFEDLPAMRYRAGSDFRPFDYRQLQSPAVYRFVLQTIRRKRISIACSCYVDLSGASGSSICSMVIVVRFLIAYKVYLYRITL